jgi:hypothetical protein
LVGREVLMASTIKYPCSRKENGGRREKVMLSIPIPFYMEMKNFPRNLLWPLLQASS